MVKKIFKLVLAVIAVTFLVGVADGYRTKKKLVGYCRETVAGTSLVAAKEKALQSGFRFFDSTSPTKALVTASGVMGRYVCEIEHDGERVVKATLLFKD
ncbi:hypothetical protein [Geobacter grbiciae]|uniref:hypothetical protein n=1 Tax=Geobacter grbiciae TaxID=155042 RepID=UPI001C0175CD|nr:hypothetical protein [Geobacter grbiciae]MBT1075614.1 hypothetical protein [Geobacter grbiciae]